MGLTPHLGGAAGGASVSVTLRESRPHTVVDKAADSAEHVREHVRELELNAGWIGMLGRPFRATQPGWVEDESSRCVRRIQNELQHLAELYDPSYITLQAAE